jgi:hypothetical protein
MDRFAAQGAVELLILFLGKGVAIPSAGVQADSGVEVHARILAIHKAFPADFLEIGELQVGPGFDALGNPIGVFMGAYLPIRSPSGATTLTIPS